MQNPVAQATGEVPEGAVKSEFLFGSIYIKRDCIVKTPKSSRKIKYHKI